MDEQPLVITEPETVIVSNSEEPIIEESTDEPSDAVAIAAIEADKEIKIAEIHSETEQARIEAQTEQTEVLAEAAKEDYQECLSQLQMLKETVERLETTVNSLTPPPVLEVVTMEELPTAPETNLTQPSIAAPTLETMTEPLEESEEEKPEPEVPSRVRKFIAI